MIDQVLKQVETSLDDDKAKDVTVIELEEKSAIADFMVIASGNTQRQVGAMADHIVKQLKGMGLGGIAVEGMETCDWVLIDAGDVLVHLFRPEVREFYSLEKIWQPAPAGTARTSGQMA